VSFLLLLLLLPLPDALSRYMMREKLEESSEWKGVTSAEQRQACSDAVAAAVTWFDEEAGVDTNTSQVERDVPMIEIRGCANAVGCSSISN
jgi:hypothetical protein